MNTIKSMYLHVPFCNSICSYCDFARVGYNENLSEKWLNEIYKEIDSYDISTNLETIYIGGGTPTALSVNQLERLLSKINVYAKNVIEYTIEVNPESLNEEKIKLFTKYGINRVSMGVQSTDPKLLKLMNRKHTFNDVKNAIKMLKENGINNISCDLIYSLPFQTMEIWENSLLDIISLEINHISIYSLTIEENSEFKKLNYSALDIDSETDMYFKAIEILSLNGFKQYEISNFAKKNKESKHNLAYWHYDDFWGIGLGASGKINDNRYDNTNNFIDYLNDRWIMTKYDEDVKNKMFDMIMMSLRLKEGLNMKSFENKFNVKLLDVFNDVIMTEIKNNNLIIDYDYLKCTDSGYFILNNILEKFL